MKDSLEAVTVSADKGITVSRRDTISSRNTISLSEALMRTPTLQVNDNGGMSGLKTVSLRGMGSSHTAIYIDGLKAGNVQSGQNDLGMYDIGDSQIIIDYAQNSISINTLRPTFDKLPVAGHIRMHGGSFGTYLPSARIDFRLSESISLRTRASGVFSRGDFPYTYIGNDGTPTRLSRSNNDIARIRGGLDLLGLMKLGSYHVKAGCNFSDRGTPGSTSWPSTDRQKDMNAYLQGTVTTRFSDLYTLRLSTKGSYDDIEYLSEWGDSRYGQTEIQLNTAHELRLKQWWKLSIAADFCWDALESDVYDGRRVTSFGAVASTFRFGRLSADIALEYNMAYDMGGRLRDAVSPSANIRFGIIDGLTFSALARRMYRIPTFNELFYPGYGNPELKPEDAWTGSISADFNRSLASGWKITSGLTGFCVDLSQKIISAPTETDPSIWLPYNIGKVRSAGIDAKAGTSYSSNGWDWGLDASYSWLSSTDLTPDSYSYGTQVAYTARHSLTLGTDLSWKGWSLQAFWRLKSGYCGSAGEMPGWNILDMGLSKEIHIRRVGTFRLSASAKNITDTRYETVSGYPMYGRSFIGGIEYKF